MMRYLFVCVIGWCHFMWSAGQTAELPAERQPEQRSVEPISCYSMKLALSPRAALVYPDSNMICCSGNLILYDLPYVFDSLRNYVRVITERRHQYLVCEKGRPAALLFPPWGEPRWVNGDSMMRGQWFKVFNVNQFFTQTKSTLLSSVQDKGEGALRERYLLQKDSFNLMIDLVYRDRYRSFPLTFSKELDSMKRSKLCQMEYYDDLKNATDTTIAARRPAISCMLEEEKVFDEKKVAAYFERYRKAK